jgi:hypothetical protein
MLYAHSNLANSFEKKLLNAYIITGTLINRYESFMSCYVIIHIIYNSNELGTPR